MADRGDNNFIRYIYRGEEGEIIPREATHITIDKSCTFIRAHAFEDHPNIVEVICHDRVKKINIGAFRCCPNLRRVIMPGVKNAEGWAFGYCKALTDVECSKLEIIGSEAFSDCSSLRSINLLSVRIFDTYAFDGCKALNDIEFGSKLERFKERAFGDCPSLERITIPLKDGLFTEDDIFEGCHNLRHVDLVEGELLETVAALQLEEWRNDIDGEIYSINQILASSAGCYDENGRQHPAQKTMVLRMWIRSVLYIINRYEEKHQRILGEAATTLQLVLPQDIAMNSVLPFLALPTHTFEGDEGKYESDEDYG